MYFTDRAIPAAYRCIEEHNFDFKRPVGALLPLLFAFRGVQQSTFPLFIDRFRLRCNSGILSGATQREVQKKIFAQRKIKWKKFMHAN